ncbi:hypothetical protein L596_002959 [Steinernema carpocapsae]|uniref:Uncharacterized protein n=1 Tax=Steinernema carpocapsae TaxID=34508 RepID=A0A4U8USN5_STECR|nr:hypothetical protein L596_002959 [Steinernema carpocapsae]
MVHLGRHNDFEGNGVTADFSSAFLPKRPTVVKQPPNENGTNLPKHSVNFWPLLGFAPSKAVEDFSLLVHDGCSSNSSQVQRARICAAADFSALQTESTNRFKRETTFTMCRAFDPAASNAENPI